MAHAVAAAATAAVVVVVVNAVVRKIILSNTVLLVMKLGPHHTAALGVQTHPAPSSTQPQSHNTNPCTRHKPER